MNQVKILPSILSVDPQTNEAIQSFITDISPLVDGIHYDVMDGQFVPPTTYSIDDYRALEIPSFTDIHLMVNHPEEYIEPYSSAGASLLTIHYEAEQKDPRNTLELIKQSNCLAGLSIKPKTLVTDVPDDLWGYCDVALIMSVEPGWGGQSFIEEVLDKVRYLREKYPEKDINIDGGINDQTAPKACAAGCNMLVSGSYLSKSDNYKEAIKKLRINKS